MSWGFILLLLRLAPTYHSFASVLPGTEGSELERIFRHELQHIRRRDFVFDGIASFCRALLFFYPAVWYAMLRLKLESELACDLAVVSDSPERRANMPNVSFALRG